ncbi:outer membrane lipoprotein [Methylomarinovum tepidoasis]|uniref:Outer membrane lipoprotein n=1 Tax=Methylomarinovum tepidoasis TaxID=2840183 RepID=A0AAU9CCP0_9GAMM|nr:Slp family lipoprotein [Methylomarinovum sp. IN45]BCX89681.1 outer membrane lipoprotein [Methylomarinovum sp. IN45]
MKAFVIWLGLLSLLAGCAGLPPELQGQAAPLSLAQVQAEPEKYRGQTVRWGGTILQVKNAAEATRIQILARPLDRSGRPREDGEPLGRFMATTPAFLDPAIYLPGRELTVLGTVTGSTEISVGERKLRIPLIAAKSWHLWPRREKQSPPPVYPTWYWWYDFWWWYYPWGPCCWY